MTVGEQVVTIGPAVNDLLRNGHLGAPSEDYARHCTCGAGESAIEWHASRMCPVPLMIWRQKAFDLAQRLDDQRRAPLAIKLRPTGETSEQRLGAKLPADAIGELTRAQACPWCGIQHNHPVVMRGDVLTAVCDSLSCRREWSVS